MGAQADSGAGCSLQLNGKSQDFQQCKTLTSGVQLLWNLADQPVGTCPVSPNSILIG